MKVIERKISEAVRDGMATLGGSYRVKYLGGATQVSRGFSLSRKPRVSVKLYDTYVVQATGTPDDYALDIDLGYNSPTTRSRVNAALAGLGVGITVRQVKGEPAVLMGGKVVSTSYSPSFRVKGGEVLA